MSKLHAAQRENVGFVVIGMCLIGLLVWFALTAMGMSDPSNWQWSLATMGLVLLCFGYVVACQNPTPSPIRLRWFYVTVSLYAIGFITSIELAIYRRGHLAIAWVVVSVAVELCLATYRLVRKCR